MPEIQGGGGETRPDMRGVLPAGTTLRGYELKSILGQGAFGITYRARDNTLHRDVAIKEYLPTSLALREGRTTVVPRSADHAEQFAWGRERFLDEARTLARLDRTPAIVRVHDYLEDNGTAYMVMALIEGETLSKRLTREQRLVPEAIERLVYALLDGLEEVHGIGFLHRDIKPANIMVDGHGRPTLIDFGASRAAMAERSTTLTAIFTPGYAAAEQFTSSNLGPWSDIYGLAATLYHAITGQIPPSAIQRILTDTYQPLGELQPPGYPVALLAGIDAGLAVRVEDRPQSIAEWRHMLRSEEWLSSHEATRVTHKPGRLARAASRSRQARVTIRGPVLWGAAAAAILVLAGAGYLAYQANAPGTASTAVLSLSAEQLEQALVERRKADSLAAEKRRLEDEARQKAEAEAAAKRQAETELEQARQARQKAEDELATLKADIAARRQSGADPQGQAEAAKQRAAEEDAQRKAEAEAAGLRQAEEKAGKRAAVDAEAKRQADEALARAEAERQRADADARAKAEAETAARQQAEDEAQRKAAADAASKRQADEAQAKAQAEREKAGAEAKAKSEAETAERGLRLESADRQRLQVALTSLGFDTRGSDGVMGPRSREMIAAWQKKASVPATGFLTAAQQQALLREAAPALSKYDEQKLAEEQKKAGERKKAEDEAKARATAASAPGPSPPSAAAPSRVGGLPDGTYGGGIATAIKALSMVLKMTNGSGTGTVSSSTCGAAPMSLSVDASGNVIGEMRIADFNCAWLPAQITGRVDGGKLLLVVTQVAGNFRGQTTLTLGSAAPASPPAAAPAAAQPSVAALAPAAPSTPPDGLWRGTYGCLQSAIGSNTGMFMKDPEFTASLDMQLANASGSWKSAGPTSSNGFTQEIRVSAGPTEFAVTRIHSGQSYMGGSQAGLSGQYDGNAIRASGREKGTGRYCTFVLTRA